MRKILVLRGGALGDFIVTLPALALLRQRWPEARIELAGNATAAVLALNRGLIDAAHSQHEARWSALFGSAPLRDDFAAWLGEFDLVLNYWPDPEGELRRRFPLRAGQMRLNAAALPTLAPAAAHYCEPLRALGLETTQYCFPLAPLDCTRDVRIAPPFIAVHPGSGSPKKNWPIERWRELIAALPTPASLILGEAELELAGAQSCRAFPVETGRSKTAPLQLVNRPLEELVAHFAQCGLFLGHDSGISHLAAACGVSCVLLFGPTDPTLWAPRAPHVSVLRRGPELSAISVAEVRQALLAALADRM